MIFSMVHVLVPVSLVVAQKYEELSVEDKTAIGLYITARSLHARPRGDARQERLF